MGGRGPQPKDQSRRARTNKDPIPLRVVVAQPVGQPELPEFFKVLGKFGETHLIPMPVATQVWWKMWADSPLSADFISTDWSELLDTALLHARFWSGDHKVAGELRLRVAKYGATPEDRARLRITFAQADDAEAVKPEGESSARSRRGSLKASSAVGD